MKKLFSAGLVGWLFISLVACGSNAPMTESPDPQIAALEAQIETLENEKNALESALSAYENTDGLVTFVIEGDQPVIRSLAFEPDEMPEPMTLLVDAFGESEVVYSESEFGIFIESIGSIQPGYGAYIMIEKNNVPLSVGFSDATIDDGDVFQFSLVYWDAQAGAVRESIDRFLASEVTAFNEEFNYDVLHALALLGQVSDVSYVAQSEGETGTLKDLLVLKALGEDTTPASKAYADAFSTEVLFRASLGMMAVSETPQYDALYERYMTRVRAADVQTLSFDDLAMTVMHLKEETPGAIIDAMRDRISNLDNAPSLAFAIMALIALDENPFETVLAGGESLPDTLMRLQTLEGGFLYDFASGPDSTRQFSSPQSFLALSALEAYLNDRSAVPYE